MPRKKGGPTGQPPAEPQKNLPPTTYGTGSPNNTQDVVEGTTAKAGEGSKNNVIDLADALAQKAQQAKQSQRSPNEIRLNPYDLDLHLQLAAQALVLRNKAASVPVLYRRGDGVVRIGLDEQGRYIQRVTPDLMLAELANAARWIKVKENDKGEEEVTSVYPPKDVAKVLAASPTKDLPILRRLALTPVYSASGKLLTSGYDPESGIYVDAPLEIADISIPSTITPTDLADARHVILGEILPDFPFVSEHDRTVVISAMLLPLVRSMIDGPTPMHLIEAPTEGTGKSILVEAVILAALGQVPAAETYTADDDEMRKRIATLLDFGHDVIFLDNLEGEVSSSALATALTLDEYQDRRLGSNTLIRHSLRNTIWVASGNNVVLSKDMRRRTVRCRLDARMERPWERVLIHQFRHDPRTDPLLKWIKAHRRDVLTALVILVQAWLQAGRPIGDPTKTLGSYEQWAAVIGGILQVAGIDGFLSQQGRLYEDADSEETRWKILIEAWWEQYHEDEVDAGQLLGIALLGDILPDISRMRTDSDRAQRTKMGQLLSKRRDRVVSGLAIQVTKLHPETRRQLYRLTPVDPATGLSDDAQKKQGGGDGLFDDVEGGDDHY